MPFSRRLLASGMNPRRRRPREAPLLPPRRTRHHEIFEILQREIASAMYAATGQLPGEIELTRRFAASRPTVARALNDLRDLGLIERRAGAGTFLRQANAAPGGLFGLIGAGLGRTEILAPIAAEITRSAQAHRYRLILGDAGLAESDAVAVCKGFRHDGVSGVFLAPLESVAGREAVNRCLIAALAASRIPVVLLDRDVLDFPGRSPLDLVASDDVRAGHALAAHLIGRGRRRIGFVARPNPPSTTDLRIAGCRSATAALDTPLLVRFGDPEDRAFATTLVRDDGCDAVICANDQTAGQLMRALVAAGVCVPKTVALAGFDDVQQSTALPVPLTTMRIACREIGVVAVRTMLERVREPEIPPRQILLDARLVVRRSTSRK